MSDRWAEQFVDRGLDKAWLDFRVRIADEIEALRDAGFLHGFDVAGPSQQVLHVTLDASGVVQLIASDGIVGGLQLSNSDEAAFEIGRQLRETWGVVHPRFVEVNLPGWDRPEASDLVDRSATSEVPEIGHAESNEQLETWVRSCLAERVDGELKVDADGDIPWLTPDGNSAWVRVRNSGRIELFTILARNVDVEKAHEFIDRTSPRLFALKFYLSQGCLFMSQVLVARPFVPEQLGIALRSFVRDVDRLAHVRNALERPEPGDREQLLAQLEQQRLKIEALESELSQWRGIAEPDLDVELNAAADPASNGEDAATG